jgi:O-antigen/teichoic acid export membrane protein
VRTPLLYNFSSQAVLALAYIVCTPFYLRLLGPEAYGLIGLSITLQAFALMLDFGIFGAMNKEIASANAGNVCIQGLKNIIRTFESVFWLLTAALIIIAWLASGFVSKYWLQATSIDSTTLRMAVFAMASSVFLQLPNTFYLAALRGLEKHAAVNLTIIFGTLIRNFGVIALLIFCMNGIVAYFLWFLFWNLIQATFLHFMLWKIYLKKGVKPVLTKNIPARLYKFSYGLFLIGITSFILMHADKLILSRTITLHQFSYYSLAATLAAGLTMFISPFFNTLYPRFSSLVASDDSQKLTKLYHKSCMLMATILCSSAAVVIIYSDLLISLWTSDLNAVAQSSPIVKILAAGTLFNGLLTIPYALQLANNWTSLTLKMNILAALILTPLTWYAVNRFGPIGAAYSWFLLNLTYLMIALPIIHNRILNGQFWIWLSKDTLPQLLIAFSSATLFKLLLPDSNSLFFLLLISALILCLTSIPAIYSLAIRNDK